MTNSSLALNSQENLTLETVNNDGNNQQQTYLIASIWYESCATFGYIFAIITYSLLFFNLNDFYQETSLNRNLFLLWSLTPLTLTFVAFQSPEKQRIKSASVSTFTLLFLQLLTLWFLETRIISLGIASSLMFINARFYPNKNLTIIHLGFILSLIITSVWQILDYSKLFLLGGILTFVLWILSYFCRQSQKKLIKIYGKSADSWAIFICSLELFYLTINYFNFLPTNPNLNNLLTSLILGLAIIYRYHKKFNNLNIYTIGWLTELTLIEGMKLINSSIINIATANIILGLITLILSHNSTSRFPQISSLISWQVLPLIYSIIGLIWRLNSFSFSTGLLVVGASITCFGVSIRYRNWKWLTYLSLAGISIGCYEKVIYHLSQSSGGSIADGLTILAGVAAIIALIYRLFIWFWHSRGKKFFITLNLTKLTLVAHFHWALGSLLKVSSAGLAIADTENLTIVSMGISITLALYAIIEGRDSDSNESQGNDWWVYVGLVEMCGTIVYARLIWTQLSFLDPLQVILTCFVALFIYQIPWQNLGWQSNPWHRFAIIIPALMSITSTQDISYLSLLAVAAFYGRVGLRQKNIRWSYLSLGFIDWAIVKFFAENQLNDILYFTTLIGLSILYIAQFEPDLRDNKNYKLRHQIRVLGSSLICLSALVFHTQMWLLVGGISLIFILAGLGLKIRAFLYVGTIIFILNGSYQLIVLINQASLSKWIIGLITGILFIVIASLFERKREVIFTAIQDWFTELNQWE